MLTLDNYLDVYDKINEKFLLTHELGGKYTNKTLRQELECSRDLIDAITENGEVELSEISPEALERFASNINIAEGIENYFSQACNINQALISCMRQCSIMWANIACSDADDVLDLSSYKIAIERALDTLVGGNNAGEVY